MFHVLQDQPAHPGDVPVLRAMLQESEAVVNQKKGGEHR